MTYAKAKRDEVLALYRENRSSLKTSEVSGVSHSTVSRIVNAAGAKYERPPLTKAALACDPGHPSHGKTTGYEAGCRCERCVNARRIADKKTQTRRVLRGGHPYGERD